MLNRTELKSGPVSVVDYRCTAGPEEEAFGEVHRTYSVSYVRKGSFGYTSSVHGCATRREGIAIFSKIGSPSWPKLISSQPGRPSCTTTSD